MSDAQQSRLNLFDEEEQTSFDSLLAQTDPAGEPAAPVPTGVECLGRHFESDAARRAFFTELLRQKLADPAFRAQEGFPLGSDEDILALSDPPYYTACPNPFLGDFIEHYGQPYDPAQPYHREPFAADVSEGKTDPIYTAHSYHTKVPHRAIMRYILHYTEPGDLVMDGFCGTGMTGVAAQLCGDKSSVEALGYKVLSDGTILNEEGQAFSKLGVRYPILNDLSPAATFIAHNYNNPVSSTIFTREAQRILREVEAECGWLFETQHTNGQGKGRIIYTIWSDVFICSNCTSEVVFWDAAVDKNVGKVNDTFPCPTCNVTLTKRSITHAWTNRYDKALDKTIQQAKQVPVMITYVVAGKRYEKKPDALDLDLINKIEQVDINQWYPTTRLPLGDEARRNDPIGLTHSHHFFTKRNLWVLSSFFNKSELSALKWLVTGVMQRASKQHQIAITRIGGEKAGEGGATAGHRRGTLYIPSNQVEFNPFELLTERLRIVQKAYKASASLGKAHLVSTDSASSLQLPPNSMDYIFVDPPFGGNIMYSELNYIWESWLKVLTDNKPEAIQSNTQHKNTSIYQSLMTACFQQFYNCLKPGRKITIEFHNSKNTIWHAIQEALQAVGFVIADVSTLDKQLQTHTQRTAAGSVNKDLVITAYKPNGGLDRRFELEGGSEAGVWDFVRTHLGQLPVFVNRGGQAEPVVERMRHMLYDRMIAFHVQHGVKVPLSAGEFFVGLHQQFPARDDMYFLPEQIDDYDRKRAAVTAVIQLPLIITGESTAIQWLRQQLQKKPQTFQEIQPVFMRELGGWQKHETPLELSDLLDANFFSYDGSGPLPAQLVSWLRLSSTHRPVVESHPATDFNADGDLLNPESSLALAARDHWYVPNPLKTSDLEKRREKALLQEFDTYVANPARKLKLFRLEAVRAGFQKAWKDSEYKTILAVAAKLPDSVIEEDTQLLLWRDNSNMRLGLTED